MGVEITMDTREFELFKKRVDEARKEAFIKDLTNEIALRLLRKVIKRTPVGQYPAGSGRQGGTLRRGWNANQNIEVEQSGSEYSVTIINPVEYASYVEYGHRTANHMGWVPGQFFLKFSEDEIRAISDKLVKKRVEEKLREVLNA